jgi:hypothetical protein
VERIVQGLGLSLNAEKTRIVDAADGFDFLGMHFRLKGKRRRPSCERERRLLGARPNASGEEQSASATAATGSCPRAEARSAARLDAERRAAPTCPLYAAAALVQDAQQRLDGGPIRRA